MKMTDRCYWCGEASTSYEHVPPENLFPKEKKKNLITVPSCQKHNQQLSKLDEAFRFYLQAIADSPDANRLFDDKTIRSITRPGSEKFSATLFHNSLPAYIDGRETRALRVDARKQKTYFEKIIRGIYYHLFRRAIKVPVYSVSPYFRDHSVNYEEISRRLFRHLLQPQAVEGKVGQPEIFRYRYYHDIQDNGETFLIRMFFYGNVDVMGFFSDHMGNRLTNRPGNPNNSGMLI